MIDEDTSPRLPVSQAEWDELEAAFGPRMWAVARAFGLSAADAADAVQAAWLRLVESFDRIRDPSRIGAWLVTTTRNEAALLCRKARGVTLTCTPPETPEPDADPAMAVLSADEARRLWAAVDNLDEPCRTLLRLLVTAPESGYARIAARLNLPIGSVGPMRGRCLGRLRKIMETVR